MDIYDENRKLREQNDKLNDRKYIAEQNLAVKEDQFQKNIEFRKQQLEEKSRNHELKLEDQREKSMLSAVSHIETLNISHEQRLDLIEKELTIWAQKQGILEEGRRFEHERGLQALFKEMKLAYSLNQKTVNNAHNKEIHRLKTIQAHTHHNNMVQNQHQSFMEAIKTKLSIKEYEAKKEIDLKFDKLKRDEIAEESRGYQDLFKNNSSKFE